MLSEGRANWVTLLTWGLPFGGFYGGLLLRHYAFRGKGNPSLVQRLAIALPVSLMLISSFNALLGEIGQPSYTAMIFVTGFVMEQGLLVDIGLAKFLNNDKSN